MRKVVLFIAMSLDGYIADNSGNVDWLAGEDPNAEGSDSYEKFVETVDTVVMGYKTYNQIVTELSPDEWVYEGMTSYVITHRDIKSDSDDIIFVGESPSDLIRKIRKEEGKDVWIYGGASVVQDLVASNLIDEYRISIIPTILGEGISLFGNGKEKINLSLTKTETDNGIIELTYRKRDSISK